MRINKLNCDILQTKGAYVHDALFTGFFYDYKQKQIKFEAMEQGFQNKKYKFTFENVIGFNMSCTDFWGSSHYIYDWEAIPANEYLLINRLKKEALNNDFHNSRVLYPIEYFETKLILISGDELTIACEWIEFEALDL